MYPWSSDLVMRFFSKQTFGQDSTPAQDGAVLVGLRVKKSKLSRKYIVLKYILPLKFLKCNKKLTLSMPNTHKQTNVLKKRLDKSLRFISGATNNPLYATGSHSKWA